MSWICWAGFEVIEMKIELVGEHVSHLVHSNKFQHNSNIEIISVRSVFQWLYDISIGSKSGTHTQFGHRLSTTPFCVEGEEKVGFTSLKIEAERTFKIPNNVVSHITRYRSFYTSSLKKGCLNQSSITVR